MATNLKCEMNQRGAGEIVAPHVVALIRERERRLAALRRYDRYITRAAGHLPLQDFWRKLKRQDEDDIQRLNNWLERESAVSV